jgi:hypothetical protein
LHFQNFKNFLGEGLTEPPAQTPPPILHGASRLDPRFAPRCALRAISALRASMRVSRKLGASRLHVNVVRMHIQHLHRSRKNPAYATETRIGNDMAQIDWYNQFDRPLVTLDV